MVPEVPGGLVALSGGPSLLSLAAIDFGGKLKKKEIQRITKSVCFVFRGILTCSLMAVYHPFGIYRSYVVILGGGENSATDRLKEHDCN